MSKMIKIFAPILMVLIITVMGYSADPSRFPNGLNNSTGNGLYANMGIPDVTKYHYSANDFDQYVSGNWTITDTGSVAGSTALTDADGGVLLLTAGTGTTGSECLQRSGMAFSAPTAVGGGLWFEGRFKTSGTTNPFIMGLFSTGVTVPVGASQPTSIDGMYFSNVSGTATIDFKVKSGTNTSTLAAVGTLSTSYIKVGFYYNYSKLYVYVDGAMVGTVATTYVPTSTMNVAFGVKNEQAIQRTMSVDYYSISKMR